MLEFGLFITLSRPSDRVRPGNLKDDYACRKRQIHMSPSPCTFLIEFKGSIPRLQVLISFTTVRCRRLAAEDWLQGWNWNFRTLVKIFVLHSMG